MINLKGKTIKHDRNMDICYHVLSQYEGDIHLKLKVLIINMGYINSFVIFDKPSWIEINKFDLDDWVQLVDISDNKCYRNCTQLRLL